MIYIIKYNGTQFAEVDINIKDLAEYKKVLFANLPKATMERKLKSAITKRPQ
jgi:hypothetical protein